MNLPGGGGLGVPGVFGFVFRFIFWFYACFPGFSISTVNGFPVCLFYGLFSGFVFWFYGLVSGFGFGVSAYLRLVRSWILFYGLFSALFSAFTALVSWFQLVTGMLDLVSIFRF